MYTVKVDSAGRIKLPADFHEYFNTLGHTRFFITSLDRDLGVVYPVPLWRATEKFLEEFQEDPELADNAGFNAAELGGEAEMDATGRLLLPAELRKALGIENGLVRLKAAGQKIEILSERIFEERRERGKAVGPAGIARLRKAGMPK